MKACKKCGYEHGGINCFDAGRLFERGIHLKEKETESDRVMDITKAWKHLKRILNDLES